MSPKFPVPFDYEGRAVRVVASDNGEPWFVAADVCASLDIKNSRDALSRLDDDEKGVGSTDTLGGTQEMTLVNESGLYSLILGSRKPEAKKFKKWVTSEVLPTIRKTGAYFGGRQPSTYEQLSAHGVRLKLLKALKAETNRELRDAISQQLEHTSRLLGLPVPDADKIGRPAPLMPECVTRFWMAVEQIGMDKLNHCNDPGLIGINLNQFAELADELRVPVPARLELKNSLRESTDPAFLDVRTVHSRLRSAQLRADASGDGGPSSVNVKCWVFRKSAGT